MGFENQENIIKIGARGHQNREKWSQGYPQEAKKTKLIKNVVVLNYLAPFLWILVENWSQDGSQNRSKIDKTSMQKSIVFLMPLGIDF